MAETGISTFLSNDLVKKNIEAVVGSEELQVFIVNTVSIVSANKQLAACSNTSIMNACLEAKSLGLVPNNKLGYVYLVPYGKEAQLQIGWKGYIQLALRSSLYRKIIVTEVKEGELLNWNAITEEASFSPIEDFAKRETTQTIGYYCKIETTGGFVKEMYWSIDKMKEHAKKYSKGYKNDITKGTAYTFWSKDFDEMAKKTLIRQMFSKYGIMSNEIQRAYNVDMSVIDDNGNEFYVDNQPESAPNPFEPEAQEEKQ